MIELHDYKFSMLMGCGRDTWALGGRVFGHPRFRDGEYVHLSTPVTLDEANDILTTKSCSTYRLMNPDGNREDIITEIKEVIENGAYEVW